MKKIEIDIKRPYNKYQALIALISEIGRHYDDRQVEDDADVSYELRHIEGIMEELEYRRRGDIHSKFRAAYRWTMIPNCEYPERIEIRSVIASKEVGSITIK